MDGTTGILFWGFLIVYGIVMFILSPKTVTAGGFFNGEDRKGRDANPWMITASIFIAWIFAKSVTNAANMGQNFGIVGGVGYAVYWLCIPLTGYALYRLRRKFGATGMVSFLTEHYGVAAAFCFSAAILVRLFNEVWSNTSVVGAYYGESGTAPFIIAALLFTAITAAYCCWGGMRGSLITDIAQAILFAILLIVSLVELRIIKKKEGAGNVLKWVVGISFVISAVTSTSTMGLSASILFVFPILLSVQYCSLLYSIFISVVTIMGSFIPLLLASFISLYDLNVIKLIPGSIIHVGETLESSLKPEIIDVAGTKVNELLAIFLPAILFLIIIAVVTCIITNDFRKHLLEQYRAFQNSRE